MTPISTATNTAGQAIKVGAGPDTIAITPDGKTAYVANGISDTVTPIRTATNTALKAITVGIDPIAIAITPDGTTAYVANIGGITYSGDTVTPISTATNTALKAITVGTGPSSSRSRHQHRAQGDQGRKWPLCHLDAVRKND